MQRLPFVEVAVNSGLPQRESFSYAVPEGMTLSPGDAVFVPFGRRFLQGIVLEQVEVPAFSAPKEVDSRIDDRPVIDEAHARLARWLSDYYLAPLFASVAVMLPPGFERKPLTFYEALVRRDELAALRLPPRQRAVIEAVIDAGRIEAGEVEAASGERNAAAALSQLVQRGFVNRSYGLARPSVRTRHVRYVYLAGPAGRAREAADGLLRRRRTKAAGALELLLAEGPRLPASELRQRAGATLDVLRQLAEENLIEVREEPFERDPLAGRHFQRREAPPLTPEQASVFESLRRSLDAADCRTYLLHGVTGSGKTEVYLRALEHTIALGKRAIVLVPEIALTPQTIRRFAERFPGQIAVLHSGLSQGELFDQWHGIRDGRYAVVIGSRSAVFAPQPDLGLIVIDEEHEWTYKQGDVAPRYHAREAAEKLAELTGAVLLLGSATPDVVSYQRALWGRYELVELKQRVRPVLLADGRAGPKVIASEALPPVEVVDMRDELKGGNRSVFSRALQLALYHVLERREQAILFLNRRGTASHLQCRDCGFVPQCSSCAIALAYHRYLEPDGSDSERLLCHQCNRSRRAFQHCPMCGGHHLRPMGLGVERVEEALHELLPSARTLRWDRDVTRGRNAHEAILASFMKGEADVLIGTQMVAKGLDLPAVTLVGVISADIGLHVPDFRSAERTFQLLTQVSGRAGRVASADGIAMLGRVVIQTYTPDNYAITAAAEHDYAAFFATEIDLRREEAYPPFVRLAQLVYAHTNEETGLQRAERLAQQLRREVSQQGLPGYEIMGPSLPYVPKWHGRFRQQILVRAPDPTELLRGIKLGEGWTLDIDPASTA